MKKDKGTSFDGKREKFLSRHADSVRALLDPKYIYLERSQCFHENSESLLPESNTLEGRLLCYLVRGVKSFRSVMLIFI